MPSTRMPAHFAPFSIEIVRPFEADVGRAERRSPRAPAPRRRRSRAAARARAGTDRSRARWRGGCPSARPRPGRGGPARRSARRRRSTSGPARRQARGGALPRWSRSIAPNRTTRQGANARCPASGRRSKERLRGRHRGVGERRGQEHEQDDHQRPKARARCARPEPGGRTPGAGSSKYMSLTIRR